MELQTSIASTTANCERLEQNVVIVTIVALSESLRLKVFFAKIESSSYKQYDTHVFTDISYCKLSCTYLRCI